jgi:hypothetical protein
MHDGLGLSVTTREQGELVARLACEAVKLEVPMRADIKFGRSWGDATHSWEELHGNAANAAPMPFAAAVESEPTDTAVERITVAVSESRPSTQPPPPPINGVAQAHFTSEILLKDIVGEPLVYGKVRCPFHDDTHPSCHIYDDHYHCFSCGAHGSAIDWLMAVEGLSFHAAQDALAGFARAALARPRRRRQDPGPGTGAMG